MTEAITDFDNVKVSAEYFNAWLGHDVKSIDPKLLFDLQELFKHYASIIVPSKNVKINYPTYDASACADTQNDEIWIPTSVLEEGDIDNTIGLVVHELQHLNLSLKSSDNIMFCYRFLNKLLKSIFIGDDAEGYESLYEIINRGHNVSFSNIFGENSHRDTHESISSIKFYQKAIKDIAFFLNAVEDVRIDSLTQPNLKKYIDVGDKKHAPHFVEAYGKGNMSENTLLNVGYRFLFHHKGFIQDDYINSTYGDLNVLLQSTPFQWIPKVFNIYGDMFKEHIESLYNANKDLFDEDISGSYGVMMSEFESEEVNIADDSDDISKALEPIELEETQLDDTTDNKSADELSRGVLERIEVKMKPLSIGLIDQIEVMGRIKIYDNEESLDNHPSAGETCEWNTIIVDTI